jgi:hypothetical protein
MSDETRSEVEAIAKRRNGSVSNEQLFDLVLAVSHDSRDAHKESVTLIETVRSDLAMHCAEADLRDDRIVALEEWRATRPTALCVDRVQSMIEAEHVTRHADHLATDHRPRREDDPPETDYRDSRREQLPSNLSRDEYGQKTWLMWMVGSWVGRILLGVVIAVASGSLMLLVTYIADKWLHP